METTYYMGPNENDMNRMFDQYLYKGSESFDVALSISAPTQDNNRYMADQTFHIPSFGDEDFDIPPINLSSGTENSNNQHNMSHQQAYQQHQQMAMNQQQQQDMSQQQHYQMYMPPITEQSMMPGKSPTYVGQQPYTAAPQESLLLLGQPQQNQQQSQSQMMMGHRPGYPIQGQQGRSPQGTTGSPVGSAETPSDDSDDSTPLGQMAGVKRPSPEPVEMVMPKVVAVKKPKVTKKKKKRDPNEPQKPVSAYALFFRDTQAAIKGQNPNASFGEVSKIVASMWDALDAEHKNVYKKKTEAAKKEYLKALAAYRASLVSKGVCDGDGLYGGYGNYAGYGGYNPPNMSSPSSNVPPQLSPLAKKTPLLSSLMNDNGSGQQMMNPQSMAGRIQPGIRPQLNQQMNPNQLQAQVTTTMYMTQHMTSPSHISSPTGEQHLVHSTPVQQQMSSPPLTTANNHQQQQQQHVNPNQQQQQSPNQQSPQQQGSNGGQNAGQQHHQGNPPGDQQNMLQQPPTPPGQCIRHGCTNPGIQNSEWEDEYCSNECVVSHCRDVFNNWVASNQTTTAPAYSASVK